MSKQFQPLEEGEVVIVHSDTTSTYRVGDLAEKIRKDVKDHLKEWSDGKGIDGEALHFGSSSWKKGTVRLHLSIEFCPNEDTAQANTSTSAPAFAGGGGGNQMSAVANPAVAAAPVVAAVAAGVAVTSAATVLQDSPQAEANNSIELEIEPEVEAETFELGTMSEATGEINMHLNDRDNNGYVDFDLSDSMLETNLDLDGLVTQADGPRPSLIDEVWTEMSQPNWPGAAHA